MKVFIAFILMLVISSKIFAQDLDSLQRKFANKVCTCIGNINSYEELKPAIDKCYSRTMNFIFNDATAEEVKFYAGSGNLKLLVQKLEYHLKSYCPNVVQVINAYIKPASADNSFPRNYGAPGSPSLKDSWTSWEKKTIAFDAEVLDTVQASFSRTFLKVKLDDGQLVWVGDMTSSKSNAIGSKVRFLGYITPANKQKVEQYTETAFIIISFASVELSTKKLAMYPGSEIQIHDWANGIVPDFRN